VKPTDASFKFRPYQKNCIKKVLAGPRRTLLCSFVASGKTTTACGIMRRFKRVLVLAHRGELLDQMERTVARVGISAAEVVLMTIGTAKNMSDADLATFDLVVVDEAHRAGGPVYSKFLARVTVAKIVGLTASPHRKEGLRGEFDDIVRGPAPMQLLADGFIVNVRCWSVPQDREPNLKGVRSNGGDYAVGDLERAVNKPHLVGDIVAEWKEHASDRSTIVFATSVKHAESIVAAFRAAGVDAREVYGHTEPTLREETIAAFDAGAFPVLVNVMLLTEGIDVTRVDCIVLARPTRSIVLFLQAVGRGLRKSPTGNDLLVLDHSGAWHHHGSPLVDIPWSLDPMVEEEAGKKGGGGAKAKRCAACGFMSPIAAVECEACLAPFRVVDTETKLEEVKEHGCSDCGISISPPRSNRPWTGMCLKCCLRKRHAATTPEQRREWSQKASAAITPEQTRAANLKRKRAMTEERRRDAATKARATAQAWQASMTPEQRAEINRQRSEGALKKHASLTPEQRSEVGRRAAATRRAKAADMAREAADMAREAADMAREAA